MPRTPDPTRRLDAVTQVRLHRAQLEWLKLQAGEGEITISEAIRGLVWEAILADPHAADVVGDELLLDLVRDDPDSFSEAPALQALREPRLPT